MITRLHDKTEMMFYFYMKMLEWQEVKWKLCQITLNVLVNREFSAVHLVKNPFYAETECSKCWFYFNVKLTMIPSKFYQKYCNGT